MYYDYPEQEEAYEYKEQFMFGDDILATAVVQPCDSLTGLADRKIWLPEGQWYDFATGMMYSGGRILDLQYTLSENPWYAKAGSIIPMNPSNIENLQEPCNTLVLTFVPGADGTLSHYEDDGISQDYKNGGTWTQISKVSDGNTVRIVIGKRIGGYDGAPEGREYELRFPAMFPPQSVKVDGNILEYARFPEGECWTYDAYTLSPIIYIGERNCSSEVTVELELPQEGFARQDELYGLAGIFKRCVDLTVEFKYEQGRKDAYLMLPVEYLKVSQCPNRILESPFDILKALDDYLVNIERLFPAIDAMTLIGDDFKVKLKSQLIIEK
jgi:alpha-glucosidase